MGAVYVPDRHHVHQRKANGDKVQLRPLENKLRSHTDERGMFVAYFGWNCVTN